MCGIVGMASQRPSENRDLLGAMCRTLRHRGPDDEGLWWSADGRVGFAQRRLAIIDLSPLGHQPMSDAGGGLHVTFNGEIYNFQDLRSDLESRGHSFQSASDTEVLLKGYREWGSGLLPRLNGMFAFALFDEGRRRVLLARDRAGEKPLFYRVDGMRLSFASELKALFADSAAPRALDHDALEFFLTYGYVPAPRCILRGYLKLEPGHSLLFDLESGQLTKERYWTLPEPAADGAARHPEELSRTLETLLEDAVRRQLVADVPVGVLLSGGVDSSLITAMAARASSHRVKTFNVSFPGSGGFDEAPYARLVARHFGTEHREMTAEPASVELLPALARQYDEPIADSSMVPTFLVSRLIRQEATVALGGDGGDELFGGYPHYAWIQRQERVRRFIPSPIRALIGRAASRLLPVGLRGRNYILGFSADLPRSIAHVNVFFDSVARRRLLRTPPPVDPELAESFKAGLCSAARSPLQNATRVDFATYLPDDILVKVDRASMLSSLEVRAPFLDHRIVEFAFSQVPDALRATASELKKLPKLLARRVLPADLDLRRKQGFSIPLAEWLKGDWGRFVEATLSDADPVLFDRGQVARLVGGQRRGLSNTHRLFALTMFELWRREYRIATG